MILGPVLAVWYGGLGLCCIVHTALDRARYGPVEVYEAKKKKRFLARQARDQYVQPLACITAGGLPFFTRPITPVYKKTIKDFKEGLNNVERVFLDYDLKIELPDSFPIWACQRSFLHAIQDADFLQEDKKDERVLRPCPPPDQMYRFVRNCLLLDDEDNTTLSQITSGARHVFFCNVAY